MPVRQPTSESFAGDLLTRLWVTKSVRFESSRRLRKVHGVSRLAISMLSVYVICITVVDIIYRNKLHAAYPLLIPLATVVAPIFILVIEAHEGGKHYPVTAERMHRSAQRIQILHARLEELIAKGTATPESVGAISREYQDVLCDFSEHHENVDYYYVQALYPDIFNAAGWRAVARIKFRGLVLRWFDIWLFPGVLIVVPGILLVIVIYLLV